MGIFDSIKKKPEPKQNIDPEYAVSIISGHYEVRTPDINLWCIGRDFKPCIVVIPLSAWEQMNSIITLTSSEQWGRLSSPDAKHSKEQKLVISITDNKTGEESSHEETTMSNCGFKNLYTPILLPVLMSVAVSNDYFIPIENYLRNRITPPKSLAQSLLQNVEFIESDESLSIPLARRSKNLKKSDKYSRFPNGDKIEIFETYNKSNYLSSICPSCVNLETRQEGTLWRCRRIDLMERELGEKAALLQVEATFKGELQNCNYFEQGPGRLRVG
jgi:hypothetical protein